jgi:hypothetical protein
MYRGLDGRGSRDASGLPSRLLIFYARPSKRNVGPSYWLWYFSLLHLRQRRLSMRSFAMKGDEEKARAAGCDHYITKPYSPMQLLKLVRGFLGDA